MFKIKRSTDGQFYFTFHAKNGKVRMTSETYTRKETCKHAIEGLYIDVRRMSSMRVIDETK
jgi:uncharacterized protein